MAKDKVSGVQVAYYRVVVGTTPIQLIDQHTINCVSRLKSDSGNDVGGWIKLGTEEETGTYPIYKGEVVETRGDLYNVWVHANKAGEVLHIRIEKDILRIVFNGILTKLKDNP